MGQRSYDLMKERFELSIVTAAYAELYRTTLGQEPIAQPMRKVA